ncbi:unnamed protein product, partial [Candidula unifasciata]
MIRGRKEGSTYASWFIGFDHDNTFGLPAFPELPPQSPHTPVHNKPVSRASSLETLLPAGQSKDLHSVKRSLTPVGTQTSLQTSTQSYTQTTEEAGSQTPYGVSSQTYTESTEEAGSQTPYGVSSQTYTQSTEEAGSQTASAASKQTYSRTAEVASQTQLVSNRIYGLNSEEVVSSRRISVSRQPYSQTTEASGTQTQFPDPSRLWSTEEVGSSRRLVVSKQPYNIYKEAFDGAKRAEEFKFRVKFDKLIGDLHLAIEENSQNGLTSVASPSYGDMMLTYKDRVKDLLKGFTQRLQIAYENFGAEDSSENTGQKVRQNVSRFIEELIGETVDLTSDEAVSDLSSLSDDSASDQNSFEDFIAQAVVSKLLESHIKGVNETVQLLHNNNYEKNNLTNQRTETQDNILGIQKDKLTSYDLRKSNKNIYTDDIDGYSSVTSNSERAGQITLPNGGNHSNHHVLSHKSDSIHSDTGDLSDEESVDFPLLPGKKAVDEDCIKVSKTGRKSDITHAVNKAVEINGINGDEADSYNSNEETDIVKEFEQLKAFVKQTRTRPQIKAIPFDDSEREEFHTRYSVFDRIQNYQPVLPDFSQFDNIDFASDDIDPDLLSMNLAIIPEETEEELEQEEEEDEHSDGKDIDQLSEFSEHDLLGRGDLDGSDDEENTFYANTSEELARISGQHKRAGGFKRLSSGSYSDNSEIDGKPNRRKAEQLYESVATDDIDGIHIPGPIVEPSRQDLKLLQDLVPAENDDPKFLVAPESVTVQEGDPVKFSCKVAGTAPI